MTNWLTSVKRSLRERGPGLTSCMRRVPSSSRQENSLMWLDCCLSLLASSPPSSLDLTLDLSLSGRYFSQIALDSASSLSSWPSSTKTMLDFPPLWSFSSRQWDRAWRRENHIYNYIIISFYSLLILVHYSLSYRSWFYTLKLFFPFLLKNKQNAELQRADPGTIITG